MARPTTLPMTIPAMPPALRVEEEDEVGVDPPVLLPVEEDAAEEAEVTYEAVMDALLAARELELRLVAAALVAPALVTLRLVTLADCRGRLLDDDGPVLLDAVTLSNELHGIAVLIKTT